MNTIEKQAIMNQYIYYLTISQNENNQNIDQI
ncbi:MAG: RluA family pseudouridine synthase, partial [Lactobacillus iners]|nr:RluA family pseudouridine synthase [Lactobacillus iners]MCT7707099.1 RluA family pseudouridine synthase [Lactobacillus iners]